MSALAQRAAQPTGVAGYDTPLAWSSSVGPNTPNFWVRPGYKVTLVADKISNARFMQLDDHGNLFVSRPDRGDILRLVRKGEGYELADTFVKGYRSVHGLDYKDGWLWFTQTGSIHKVKVGADGKPGPVEDVVTDLPAGGGHWWRSILVANDGFYTSIGDTGNITDLRDSEREKIWKFSLDGKSKTLFASGLRNTEKLRFRPGTTDVYGADHGSDWYGQPSGDRKDFQPVTDAYPPCELNLYVQGGFYGHPFFVGDNVPRLETFNQPGMVDLAAKAIPPIWPLGAHWAPNGFTFTTKNGLGPDSAGDCVIALHGSWNRSVRSGYRIERVMFDKATGKPYGSLMIVSTLGQDGGVLGRPVDVVEEPNGDLLFSDDHGNRIYRISRVK